MQPRITRIVRHSLDPKFRPGKAHVLDRTYTRFGFGEITDCAHLGQVRVLIYIDGFLEWTERCDTMDDAKDIIRFRMERVVA